MLPGVSWQRSQCGSVSPKVPQSCLSIESPSCLTVCLSVCLSLFYHLTVYQRILTIAVLFLSFLGECVSEDPIDKGWSLGVNLGAHECTQDNSMVRVHPGWFCTSPGPWLPDGWAGAQLSGTFFCTCVNTMYQETWKEHMPGVSFRASWK